ncbi:unnamed protein product [Prorocentrum cordatum]|uniref:Prolyl 4-hydroxylase alpha subunit Fe(2+) 2OG dioxygenase domain-containing protein n=1 Tax=Prorocentrum cordatum TaxID=2364126 RepID=A0ABN9VTD7_9DINO|nr:unnamed protein product [Polarella glacialis]
MSDPYFREYRAGDYINIHTDVVRQRQNVRRRLCFNYWTPSPGWDSAWGGSFVWCGGFVKRPGGGGAFPAAFRAPTRYNQVGMFVPSEDSRHFVDRVSDAADPSHHRFSFTSWLEDTTPPPGSEEL